MAFIYFIFIVKMLAKILPKVDKFEIVKQLTFFLVYHEENIVTKPKINFQDSKFSLFFKLLPSPTLSLRVIKLLTKVKKKKE